jgi:hypothetical protein
VSPNAPVATLFAVATRFKTSVAYQPTGEQLQAIAQLSASLRAGAGR